MALQTFNASALTYLVVNAYDDKTAIKSSKGFQSFFARNNPVPTMVTDSASFNYDIRRGKKRISNLTLRDAAIRSLGTRRKDIVEEKYENRSHNFPSMIESGSANWDQTLSRIFAEPEGGAFSRQARLREKVLEEAYEIINILMPGRLEVMARDSLLTGKVQLDGTTQEYDFLRSITNTITPALVWTNASATPLDDLDTLNDALRQNGKMPANFAVMGENAWDAFRKNPNVSSEADNRRFEVIRIGDQSTVQNVPSDLSWMIESGFIAQAKVWTPKGNNFHVFTYPEEYQDSADVWQSYMNVDDVFMGNSNARLDRYFGPSITMPPTSIENQMMTERLGINSSTLIQVEAGPMGVIDPRMFHVSFDVPMGAQTGVHFAVETHPLYVTTATDCFGLISGAV